MSCWQSNVPVVSCPESLACATVIPFTLGHVCTGMAHHVPLLLLPCLDPTQEQVASPFAHLASLALISFLLNQLTVHRCSIAWASMTRRSWFCQGPTRWAASERTALA